MLEVGSAGLAAARITDDRLQAMESAIAELRRVYEAVWGTRLDPRNFHRKATRSEGFLQATGRVRSEGVGRPAALFRRPPGSGPTAAVLQPPLLRPGGDAPSSGARRATGADRAAPS